MYRQKTFLFVGVICLAVYGFALAYDVPNPNLNNDERVDFADYALLASNWMQAGAGLAGDFDDSNTVDANDLMVFSWYWLTEYSEYQQCQQTDLDSDGTIAFEDVALFAQNWLLTGAGLAGDFDDSNLVDYNDLSVLTDCWLKGTRPEGIWEQFKAALAVGDVNMALAFISEASRDKYAEIFRIIEPNLADYVAGMGDLILDSKEEGKVKYEMKHQVGPETYLFPVIFIKDEQENWKIYDF